MEVVCRSFVRSFVRSFARSGLVCLVGVMSATAWSDPLEDTGTSELPPSFDTDDLIRELEPLSQPSAVVVEPVALYGVTSTDDPPVEAFPFARVADGPIERVTAFSGLFCAAVEPGCAVNGIPVLELPLPDGSTVYGRQVAHVANFGGTATWSGELFSSEASARSLATACLRQSRTI